MTRDWISEPIICDGEIVCSAIGLNDPLLPLKGRLVFRAVLLFNAWQAHACDGRQMSIEDCNRMERFEKGFFESQSEESLQKLLDDFGEFIPSSLAFGTVPKRALDWTLADGHRDA